MEFTVTTRGPTFETLIGDTAKGLKTANRKVGREVSKIGLKAMRNGAPRMWGRKLAIKSKVTAATDGSSVEFFPAPHNAGGWAIQESGRRGSYDVYPRHQGRGGRPGALKIAGLYASNAYISTGWGGRGAWTKAGDRLAKALNRTVGDVYDDALGA